MKLRRILSLVLSFVLALGLLPFEPTVVHAANATVVYITDAVGGETQTATADTEDSEGGWSYVAETATLTLNGFKGAYIEANGDLKIVLKGTNTITMASNSEYGIKVDGNLTIDDTTSPADDSLNVICNEPDASAHMISTNSENYTYINGGTVRLNGTTTNKSIIGFDYIVYVYNDANLDIDLSAGENSVYMVGADSSLYQYTSGEVSVSVESQYSGSYLICNLYQRGTGSMNLTAKGKAKVVYRDFVQSDGATGTVTVKGYLNGFSPVKKTCTVKGHDEVIWQYNTTNASEVSGYFLCDKTGAPIKDPVIEYVESQPLKVTDSALFDIPEKKVGESVETLYWKEGCKGGTGSYTFSLAEESDLPAGLSVESYGYISGAPTEAHAVGEAKIKVVSGEETAYFIINYGEIKDRDYFLTIDGTAVNMASDSTGTGYSYTAGNSTLTLSGYNGGPIISEKSLNIVLDGANTITMASDSEYGIKVDGNLTIDDTTSPAADSLNVICDGPDAEAYMIYNSEVEYDTYIDGGTVKLKGTTTKNSIIGFGRVLYVNNDANLDIDLSAGENNVYMVGADSSLYQYTSGEVSVSVESQYSGSYLITNLYQRGTGSMNLTAKGKAKVVYRDFVQSDGATGTVTVKGYLNGFSPAKKTCTVKGHDEVIWQYNTTNASEVSGYFLCDSAGAPIKDPVIKYVEKQSLKVTDSVLFDIPEKKVGESVETLYWKEGCKGGTGSYTFSLAEGSDLPAGLSVESYGYISGAPTDAHAAGKVKIKVVSGEETAYFTIDYGEITYNNPVTSMELDKTEATINKGKAVEITATINPSNADKRNVNWSCSSNLGKLEELSYDETSNTRTARFTAGNTAGTLDITAASLIGGFKKKCTVYIKEAKPTASAGNLYIEGLEAGKAYTVNGTTYTADSSGRIEIDDSWRETTVSIVRTNEESKCNSDEQALTVGKFTAVDINTLTDAVSVEYSSVTYDGNKKEPQVTITGLTQGTDYTVSYENNVNAGKATVIITGIGDYCGTLYKYFTINKASIEGFEFTLSGTEYTYDKTEKKPEISVSGLVKDVDYKVEYSNNIAVGTAKAVVTGIGNYTGSVVKTFTIKGTHTHSYADTWNKDADKHWKSCECGDKSEEAVHTAGDWIIDKEATETTVGSKHKECTVCGYSMETAEIPVTGKQEETTPVPAEKGKVIPDNQGNSYKVTKSDAKAGEVTFAKPKSSVKGTVKVPDTVTIGGITYKVTAIEASAFKNNSNITKVIIGNNVTVIGKNAFAGCKKLSSVTVGKKVKTISAGSFSGCKKLKTITVKSTKLKGVGKRALKGTHAKAKIKVPKSKLTKYKSLFKNKGQGKNVKVTK